MFKGLCAFPLAPLENCKLEEKTFLSLIENQASSGVNSIGVLGSTGRYAYMTREQRYRTTKLAISAADGIPVMISIGNVFPDEALRMAADAQKAGVSGLMLSPFLNHNLSSYEVFRLYERLTAELSVPLCVYDNWTTTGFEFTDELLIALSYLNNVGSIRLGDFLVERSASASQKRVSKLKNRISEGVTIGISGDSLSAAGLIAGCDVWYSILGGMFPHYSLRMTHAALRGDESETQQLNNALEPLWVFYRRHGSLRVIATVGEIMGTVAARCLPFPLHPLVGKERSSLEEALEKLHFLA